MEKSSAPDSHSSSSHSMEQKTEQVARENKAEKSNGNQHNPESGKVGGAERGGPGLQGAKEEQPPQSDAAQD